MEATRPIHSVSSADFSLSPALKGAVKNALAFALAYVVPLAMSWSTQAATAAITVVVIASTSTDSGNAFYKGILRVLGTVLGAAIGMTLIALFPQERMLYLLLLSLAVTLFLYLARTYKGDNTLFFLAIFAMLMVFKNGEVDDVFLYGVERTAMTLFGVIVYTLVWIYLWPVKPPKRAKEGTASLWRFDWTAPEHLKGALAGFLVFWSATGFWLYFNPPLGFTIVALATALSALTLFSPITPTMLIVAFTIGFFFAALSYVFVLPNLHDGWQLAAFLFLYAFLAHFFLPAPVAMNVLIATSTFHLQSTAFFHFGLFLTILFVLYTYLFILLLFYYIPFSSRPETMFLRLANRFEWIVRTLTGPEPGTWRQRLARRYACDRLLPTAAELGLYAGRLDLKYYDALSSEALTRWVDAVREAAEALAKRCGGERFNAKAVAAYREATAQIPFDALKKGKF